MEDHEFAHEDTVSDHRDAAVVEDHVSEEDAEVDVVPVIVCDFKLSRRQDNHAEDHLGRDQEQTLKVVSHLVFIEQLESLLVFLAHGVEGGTEEVEVHLLLPLLLSPKQLVIVDFPDLLDQICYLGFHLVFLHYRHPLHLACLFKHLSDAVVFKFFIVIKLVQELLNFLMNFIFVE